MALSAAGAITLPLENLRTLIANCTAFQTWTGTADAAEAKTRIELFAATCSTLTLPAAAIDFAAPNNFWQAQKQFDGSVPLFVRTGSADISFEMEITEAYRDDPEQSYMELANDIGGIIDDMLELAGTDEYLMLTGLSVKAGPGKFGKEESEKLAGVLVTATWWGV